MRTFPDSIFFFAARCVKTKHSCNFKPSVNIFLSVVEYRSVICISVAQCTQNHCCATPVLQDTMDYSVGRDDCFYNLCYAARNGILYNIRHVLKKKKPFYRKKKERKKPSTWHTVNPFEDWLDVILRAFSDREALRDQHIMFFFCFFCFVLFFRRTN